MSILFTGGAGFIGSHCCYEFIEAGEDIIVLDNFSTGFKESLPKAVKIIEGSVGDVELLDQVFSKNEISTVIHFAGSLIVEESVLNPSLYYQNNVVNSFNLLSSCIKNNIKKFIFSSTASIYGSNPKLIMKETDQPMPENPYAESKLIVESMIKNFHSAYGLNAVILRYFNVAGADPKQRVGQRSKKSTHLIKLACELALGLRDELSVFGTDYPTKDGTCVRDYIHVSDLANAHKRSFDYLNSNEKSCEVFNCGYGVGYSVKEILSELERLIGKKLNVNNADRRLGDPSALIADSSKLKSMTGWQPKFDNLEIILKTALDWERLLQIN